MNLQFIYALDKGVRGGKVTFVAERPEGTKLILEVQAAEKEEDLSGKDWLPVNSDGRFLLDSKDRHLQYRAVFVSDNGDYFLILDRVTIIFH